MGPLFTKKRLFAAGVASLVFIGGGTLTIGEGGRGLVSAALADPLSVLGARSPGVRPAGALTATKLALADARNGMGGPDDPVGAGDPFVPSERVLSTVRDRPPAAAGQAVPEGGLVPIAPVAGGSQPGPGAGGIAPGGGFVSPGGGGGGVVIPGGGGTTPGGTVTPPGGGGGVAPPNPGPVSGVPEPALWVTMMAGICAIGGMLRHKRRLASRDGASYG